MAIPSYRAIPGTNPQFLVDAFRYRPIQQDKVYFLTHAHSDHYGGLGDNWSGGLIYCSEVTARLVHLLTGVPIDLLRPVPMDVTITVHGVQVTFIDANHCPGAAQILFEVPDGRRYIHCGDMRYSPKLLDNPHLQRFRNADAVFLDNTYAHPRHAFPAQEEAVEFVAKRIQELLQEDADAGQENTAAGANTEAAESGQSPVAESDQQQEPQQQLQLEGFELDEQAVGGSEPQQQQQQPEQQQDVKAAADDDDFEEQQQAQQKLRFRRLYLISTYVIGKERLLMAVASRTGKKLLVTQRKLRLLRAMGLTRDEIDATFTTDPTATPIRVVRWGHLGDSWPYFRPNFTNMEADRTAADAQEVVGFVPTGWTYEMRKAAAAGGPYPFPVRTKAACSVWLIPYSEHSSFPELREYVGFIKPKQVIPTVGVGADGPENDKKVASILKHFRGLLDETANKAAFIARLGPATGAAKAAAAAGGTPKPTASGRTASIGVSGGSSGDCAGNCLAAAAAGVADVVDLAADEDAAGAVVVGAAAGGDEGFLDLPPAMAAAACADVVMTEPSQLAAGADKQEQQGDGSAPGVASNVRQPASAAAPAGDSEAAAAADAAGAVGGVEANVQVLRSIAGPGCLSDTEAQQLLAAASGDLNAAVNALLDKQSRPQQQQQQRKSPAPLSGKKRSTKDIDSGTAAAVAAAGGGAGSSKKARQQQKKGGSASVPGQAAITSFFGSTKSPVKQQQQQQQPPPQQQQRGKSRTPGKASGTTSSTSQASLAKKELQQQQPQGRMQQQQQRQQSPPILEQQPAQKHQQQLGGEEPVQAVDNAAQPTRAMSPTSVVVDGVSKVLLPPLRKQTSRPKQPPPQQQQQPALQLSAPLQAPGQEQVLHQLQQGVGPSQLQLRPVQQQSTDQPTGKVVLPALPRRAPPGIRPAAEAAGAAAATAAGGDCIKQSTLLQQNTSSSSSPTVAQQQQQQHEQQQQAVNDKVTGAAAWHALLPGNRAQRGKASARASSKPTIPAQHPVGNSTPAAASGDTDAPPPPPPAAAAAAAGSGNVPAQAAGAVTSNASSLGVASTADVVPAALRQAPLLPLQRYNPVDHAVWQPGQSAPYLALALTLAAVDGTTKRNQMALGMTNFFRSLMLLSPQDVVPAAYLLCGRIGPEYVSCELNIGGSVVSSALCDVCGVSRSQLRDMYKQHGDLGDVAQACRRKQTLLQAPAPLTISSFFDTLHKLRELSGQGANARRQAIVSKLLRSARDVETRYLVRTLIMCLRVGAGYRSVLPPLAKAALLHRSMVSEAAGKGAAVAADGALPAPAAATAAAYAASSVGRVSKAQLDAASAAVLAAYHRCPNMQIIADVLMTHGPEALEHEVQLSCGVPVKPMLARPCSGAADALKLLSNTAAAGAAAAAKGRVKQATTGTAPGAETGAGERAGVATGAGGGEDGEVVMLQDSDELGGESGGEEEAEEDTIAVDSGDEDDAATAAAAAAAAAAATSASGAPNVAAVGLAGQSVAGAGSVGSSGSSSSSDLCLLAEFKYDGQRAQIHVSAEREVRIFSRNCEEHTGAFPDVIQAILAALDPSALPVVLDAELVAVDRANSNRLRAFQELATRRRGSSSAAAAAAGGTGGGSGLGAGGGLSGGTGGKGAKRGAAAAGLGSGSGGRRAQQQKLQLAPAPTSSAQLSAVSAEGTADSAAAEEAGPTQQHQQTAGLVPKSASGQGQGQQSSSGVDVCVFVFDALCVRGEDLMSHSLRERRAAAAAALTTLTPGVVQLAQGVEVRATGNPAAQAAPAAATASEAATAPVPAVSAAAAEGAEGAADDSQAGAGAGSAAVSWAAADQQLSEYLFTAIDAGCEGLMLKLLDGPASGYAPAQRGLSWLKLKRDYLEGLADSLDLVPIGAWYGQGRKVKWFSPFLLAVYDRHSETFQSLCRCMSGFTDEFYAAAKERLSASIIPGPKPYYNTGESPSVWFEPTEVWEVRGADLSISPVHRAATGLIHPDRGIGLRFPRFLRVRPDKAVEDASGPDLVQQLYNRQNRRVHQD